MKTIIYSISLMCLALGMLTQCNKDKTVSPSSIDACAGSNFSVSISSPDMSYTSLKGIMTAIGWEKQPGEITLSVPNCTEEAGFGQSSIYFNPIFRESLDNGVRT